MVAGPATPHTPSGASGGAEARAEPAETAETTETTETAETTEICEPPKVFRRDSESTLERVLAVVSAIGPPITAATALLVYFGWARSDAQARAMGLDVSLFRYTPQDYGLRSIRSLFFPLVCIVLVSLLWLAADTWLRNQLRPDGTHPRMARIPALVITVGLGLAVASLTFAVISPPRAFLFVPFLTATGFLLAEWGMRLRRLTSAHTPLSKGKDLVQHQALEATFVFTLVTVLLFWGVSDFAQVVGRGQAAAVEAQMSRLPRADVYSPTELSIGAPGVTLTRLGTESAPIYKYTGLRLLVLSGERFFFLPEGWTLAQGTVIVLPDSDAIRVEFGNG